MAELSSTEASDGDISELLKIQLRLFLSGMDFCGDNRQEPNDSVQESCYELLRELGLSDENIEKMKAMVALGSTFAVSTYGVAFDKEVQALAATYTALYLTLDDFFADLESLEMFSPGMVSGAKQLNPYLSAYANLLKTKVVPLYGGARATAIIIAALDGVHGCVLELQTQKQEEATGTSFKGFAEWLRYKTGLGIVYAHFFFPTTQWSEEQRARCSQFIPAFGRAMTLINDVMSFYKERVLANEVCLISCIAREQHVSELMCLEQAWKESVAIHGDIMKFLGDFEPEIARTYHAWMMGFVGWHLGTNRYKMGELGLGLELH